MERLRQRVLRLLGFVEQLKRGRHPNAESYAAHLAEQDLRRNTGLTASVRTVKRDIAYLRDVLGAPLDYDRGAGGYELVDPNWCFPLQSVGGAEVFPNVVLPRGATAVNPVFREAMYSPVSLTEPLDVDVQELVPLVLATHGTPAFEPDVVEPTLYAWRDRRLLRIEYVSPRRAASVREVEVHAVFAQEGIWYARAWCRLRGEPRTFALHRMQRATLLDETFAPHPEIVATLAAGNVLGFRTVRGVEVGCPAEYAGFYAEREWFAGQYDRRLPDGSLHMLFPEAPRPVVVSWVLYNAPELEVLAPLDLRAEVAAKAAHLANAHRVAGIQGQVEKCLRDSKRRGPDHAGTSKRSNAGEKQDV